MDYLVELDAAHHVVGQIVQADLPCRPRVADGADVHGVHRVRYEAEDMLDPCPVSGFRTVADLSTLE